MKTLLPSIATAAFLSAASTRAQVEYVDPMMGGQEMLLGNTPNKKLGSDPVSFPPSGMVINPGTYR